MVALCVVDIYVAGDRGGHGSNPCPTSIVYTSTSLLQPAPTTQTVTESAPDMTVMQTQASIASPSSDRHQEWRQSNPNHDSSPHSDAASENDYCNQPLPDSKGSKTETFTTDIGPLAARNLTGPCSTPCITSSTSSLRTASPFECYANGTSSEENCRNNADDRCGLSAPTEFHST